MSDGSKELNRIAAILCKAIEPLNEAEKCYVLAEAMSQTFITHRKGQKLTEDFVKCLLTHIHTIVNHHVAENFEKSLQ